MSNCQTTGYETRIRQDCEVVTETVCTNVTVTRYNKEIQQTCTTRVRSQIRAFLDIGGLGQYPEQ